MVVEMDDRTKDINFAPMRPLSIVIVCKNEAHVIGQSLQSLQGITDDIVVYDNGSTDGTQQTARQMGVHVFEGKWEGYGKTKGQAMKKARHDWILSLDADEAIDEELRSSLLQWQPGNIFVSESGAGITMFVYLTGIK
jgi:glycosyltransferase involved in cell wall biosynthesis